MVKIKTADLIGAQLDWAVAKALNLEPIAGQPVGFFYWDNESGLFTPSTEWALAGPIIERERIRLTTSDDEEGQGEWIARIPRRYGSYGQRGGTPLIAAMRAFVASKLGSEVKTPEVSW